MADGAAAALVIDERAGPGDPGEPGLAADGRPTAILPALQLVRLSLYWLGLTAVMGGIDLMLGNRLVAEGFVAENAKGDALFRMTAFGALIAMVIQPTVGTISDYTISRWGRRKPYIVIGSLLDIVFLFGIASSSTVLAIAAFVALLQVSSNFAQGPFQGYVPDLVPEPQVGMASSLVGLFSVLGNVVGAALAYLALALYATFPGSFFVATMGLGVIEVATMLSVVVRVSNGPPARSRAGRSWPSVAREAWGTDILRERSFVYLVGSRFFVLMASSVLVKASTFYFTSTLGLDTTAAGTLGIVVLAVIVAGNVVAVVPAARISDRIGRKPVIYVACGLGAAGTAIVAAVASTDAILVALAGAALFGIGSGAFLAVDWALMTDIIPKAASGRYMGISNVATASAGVVAVAVALGLVMDNVGATFGTALGPRAALLVGIVAYGIGALLLRPVRERRVELEPAEGPGVVTTPAAPPPG